MSRQGCKGALKARCGVHARAARENASQPATPRLVNPALRESASQQDWACQSSRAGLRVESASLAGNSRIVTGGGGLRRARSRTAAGGRNSAAPRTAGVKLLGRAGRSRTCLRLGCRWRPPVGHRPCRRPHGPHCNTRSSSADLSKQFFFGAAGLTAEVPGGVAAQEKGKVSMSRSLLKAASSPT